MPTQSRGHGTRRKPRESLAEAQSTQRKTRGQGLTFDFYLSLLCKRLKSCQLAKTSSSEVVFHLPPSWLSLRALRLCERLSPPTLAALPPRPGLGRGTGIEDRRVPCPRLCVGMSSALGGAWQGGLVEAEQARCRDVRIRQHLTTATLSEFDRIPAEPGLRGCSRSRPRPFLARLDFVRSRRHAAKTGNESDRQVVGLSSARENREPTFAHATGPSWRLAVSSKSAFDSSSSGVPGAR